MRMNTNKIIYKFMLYFFFSENIIPKNRCASYIRGMSNCTIQDKYGIYFSDLYIYKTTISTAATNAENRYLDLK